MLSFEIKEMFYAYKVLFSIFLGYIKLDSNDLLEVHSKSFFLLIKCLF